jgi:hypothetical protein
VKTILAVALLAIICVPARANRPNGNDLLHECTSTDANVQHGCMAFIDGVVMGASAEDKMQNVKSPFDIRGGTTLLTMKNAVVVWLQAHPEGQNFEASVAVLKAVISTFPANRVLPVQ